MLRTLASLLFLIIATPVLAQSAAELCDQYAGHPWEPGHRGRGVEWGEVIPGPAISACREALAADPDSPEIQYRLGRTLMQINAYDDGLALVLRSARAGYPPAETAYGSAYEMAQGVDPNYAVAAEWLTKASDHGHAIGSNNLAILYDSGSGVPFDPLKARALYAKASEAGYGLAMTNLAVSYEYPKVGDPDYAASFLWYNKAAASGQIPALRGVARAYASGRGVDKNLALAFEWWLKGAEAGDPSAQAEAGLAYAYGRGIEVNLGEAERWLRASAACRCARAYLYLGTFLSDHGRGEEALQWMARAGAAGELEGYIQLTHYYAQTGDLPTARRYVQIVINYGDLRLRQEAQQLLMLIESLEQDRGIQQPDNAPSRTSNEG